MAPLPDQKADGDGRGDESNDRRRHFYGDDEGQQGHGDEGIAKAERRADESRQEQNQKNGKEGQVRSHFEALILMNLGDVAPAEVCLRASDMYPGGEVYRIPGAFRCPCSFLASLPLFFAQLDSRLYRDLSSLTMG